MAEKWYPMINSETCVDCNTCADFCHKSVFDKSKSGAEKVVYPVGCVDTCHGCGDLCPVGAITYFGDNTGWIPKALR